MALRFQSLELKDDALFGVGLAGTVGLSDKPRLLDLADRCLDRGKLRVILDLSQMSAIGGGGARILAEFQQRLTASDGEAVFAGAGALVRRFLVQKFAEQPLRFFPDVAEAELNFDNPRYSYDPDAADAEADAQRRDRDADDAPAGEGGAEAVAVVEDEEVEEPAANAPAGGDETGLGMDDVLAEFNEAAADGKPIQAGRRMDHQYTSLGDAMESLAGWSPHGGQAAFVASLRNLLFSHGLADNVVILTSQDDLLVDDEAGWEIDREGSLARQVSEASMPLTMLDLHEDDLEPVEAGLLEHLTPDLLLPVRRDGRLDAVILLMRGEGDQEFTVAEHFALELLMRVLGGEAAGPAATGEGDTAAVPAAAPPPAAAADRGDGDEPEAWEPAAPAAEDGEESVDAVLLQLALNLPEADDKPHFWRLFARHVWPVLPLGSLGFLAPGQHKPQVIAGDSDHWRDVNLGEEKLRHFLRTMQRPVQAANLPRFFQEPRESLRRAGVEWIVGLHWEDEFLGTALLGADQDFACDDAGALLADIFTETSRLLHRFANTNDTADVNLGLVRVLIGEREKRCCGTDHVTGSIVDHVHRLARVMGFAPDQERDLIYGCLLRDVGLIGKDDALMGPTEDFDPIQWPQYRRHPQDGFELLAGLNLPESITDVVHAHHERYDGKGFPRGLAGRKIPLAARVVAVVEGYVAMIEGWSSRQAVGPDEAARQLREDDGRRWDPDIVDVFLKAVGQDQRQDEPAGALGN